MGTPFKRITLLPLSSPYSFSVHFVMSHDLLVMHRSGSLFIHGSTVLCHPTGPNGLVHMMTARKRVGLLPTHRLSVRHSDDYSSSYLFTSDDSSKISSGSSSDALYDSSSGHSSSDHSSPLLPSGMRSSHQLCSSVPSIPYSSAATIKRLSHFSFAGLSRKRSRPPTTSVLISSPIPGALSPARADLLPPPKRIRSSEFVTDLEDYALRAKGIDARVVVETIAREEVETRARGPVKVRLERVIHPAVPDYIPEPA
ncbi:hypothetical protein Tco_1500685 [Tanacetum coccineum]